MIPDVDGHTWTLHVEFRSSCILFLFLHGTSIMQANLRLIFTIFSVAFCLAFGDWPIATFLAGSAIADLDLRMRRRKASATLDREVVVFGDVGTGTLLSSFRRWLQTHREQLFWSLLFFFGLIILSYPVNGAGAVWFYRTLKNLRNAQSFQQDLFFYDGRLRGIQRGLEWRFSQYIGKTSFALYLVHGTVIKSLGYFSVIQTWEHITGKKGWGYVMGIMLPLFFAVGPVVIIIADWFWRGIDIPSVRFARWLESLVKDKGV
jgi:peptidoglycan/LPS O-acetylase OafA/YrhL